MQEEREEGEEDVPLHRHLSISYTCQLLLHIVQIQIRMVLLILGEVIYLQVGIMEVSDEAIRNGFPEISVFSRTFNSFGSTNATDRSTMVLAAIETQRRQQRVLSR